MDWTPGELSSDIEDRRSSSGGGGGFGGGGLGIVGFVAVFFLFTREIIRFVQFVLLAVVIGVIFYTPSIVRVLALALTHAFGVH